MVGVRGLNRSMTGGDPSFSFDFRGRKLVSKDRKVLGLLSVLDQSEKFTVALGRCRLPLVRYRRHPGRDNVGHVLLPTRLPC